MKTKRRVAVVTGAAGGMGLACARRFGQAYDLVLSDISEGRLAEAADSLRDEGYTVAAALSGDLAEAAAHAAIVEAVRGAGDLGVLIHTAGLSPTQGAWRSILDVNLVGSARLVAALEPLLVPGSVGVLIASIGGHRTGLDPRCDPFLDDALQPGLLEELAPLVAEHCGPDEHTRSTYAYHLSKRAVIRLCEARAAAWAARGARIVSISPGTTYTPMGRAEAARTPAVAEIVAATPLGRWGTAMDIAEAAHFLASDAAGFITGCDLKVDGGLGTRLSSAGGG